MSAVNQIAPAAIKAKASDRVRLGRDGDTAQMWPGWSGVPRTREIPARLLQSRAAGLNVGQGVPPGMRRSARPLRFAYFMAKYHIHVVKIVSEHQFDLVADNLQDAFSQALKLPLTTKNKVKTVGPRNKKMAITYK